MDIDNTIKSVGDAVNQVYVVHTSGMTLLTRKYSLGCVTSDSQQIGGFLAALLIFMRNSSGKDNTCEWENDGIHKLVDIGMSCARWFIKTVDLYTVAVLIPNDSVLIKESKYGTINSIADQIISSFVLFTMFGLTESIDNLKDFTSDFGNSVDNIIFEALSDYINPNIKFEVGGEIEIFDPKIF